MGQPLLFLPSVIGYGGLPPLQQRHLADPYAQLGAPGVRMVLLPALYPAFAQLLGVLPCYIGAVTMVAPLTNAPTVRMGRFVTAAVTPAKAAAA